MGVRGKMAKVVFAQNRLSWLQHPDHEDAARRFVNLVKLLIKRLPSWAEGAVIQYRDVYGRVWECVDEETGEWEETEDVVDVELVIMPVAKSKFNNKTYYFKHTWRPIKFRRDAMMTELDGCLVLKDGSIYSCSCQESCTGSGAVTVYPGRLLAKIQL